MPIIPGELAGTVLSDLAHTGKNRTGTAPVGVDILGSIGSNLPFELIGDFSGCRFCFLGFRLFWLFRSLSSRRLGFFLFRLLRYSFLGNFCGLIVFFWLRLDRFGLGRLRFSRPGNRCFGRFSGFGLGNIRILPRLILSFAAFGLIITRRRRRIGL